MSDFDWSERFPDMRPVRSPPALVRVNGIGCAVYGSRDHDAETGTYVTTYCLSILFIPVLALTAYRVANAPSGGWYFLGRVPLSGFAKTWNVLVLLAVLTGAGLLGWNGYTNSADYLAGRKLAEADELAARGQVVQAAERYRDVAAGSTGHRIEAAQRLKGLLDDPKMHDSLADAAQVFRVVGGVHQLAGIRPDELEERGLRLVEQHAENDPKGALALIDVLRPLSPAPGKLEDRRRALLERQIARDPNDADCASELAVLYERNNQTARCEALLTPLKDRLGDREGARILGEILLRKDKPVEASSVLEPYADEKLKQLHAAEQAFQGATRQVVTNIQQGFAPGFPYDRFRTADEAGKRTIVHEYLTSRLKDDPALQQANDRYQEARRVVPVTLDLGMALLRRAQARPDPEAREADLKKAETYFKELQQDEAAESATYKLSLGQVYYWLGKQDEGRKLFNEALAAEQRKPDVLMYVGRILREVGARAEACKMIEEAYEKEADPQKKFHAAGTRSVMSVELDEKITWLKRCDPKDDQVKASLAEAQAEKAIEEGKPAEAEPHLRRAIELYEHMPENEAVLNNAALAHMALYRVTGDRRLLEKAQARLDRAVALAPRNSILLENAAHALLDAAVRDVIGPAIDLAALKRSGDRALLSYLYDDQDGQRRVTARLRDHPATVKAVSYFERLLILAPKNPDVYRQLAALYEDRRAVDKLRDLGARLSRSGLDLSAEEARTRELHAGKRDDKYRKDLQGQIGPYSRRVEEQGRGPRGLTYAVAACDLAALKMALALYGGDAGADEVVKLVESAHAAAPSQATRGYLEAALLFRARGRLAASDRDIDALARRTRRSLSPSDLLAVVLGREDRSRSQALADPDVRRCLELVREANGKFPESANVWAWAMLRSDAQQSARLAKAIRADNLAAVMRSLNVELHPFSPDSALREAWGLQVAGKEQEAAEVLRRCAAHGVPMPEQP